MRGPFVPGQVALAGGALLRNLLIAGGSDFSGQGDTLIGGGDENFLIGGVATPP
jgi:hypothetical protein